ncbi:hypothetical protein E4L95_17250 [Paracoccus liaowanqingii]|uniref:Uncharacterized protein n=1 Tax=Paracoccus liaowanqingii TaxID=2560053 RepID=A0A4Z1BWY3_9RHOB|nr:hypothetical protein [Paracoccus liaowanqingii]TGN50811.1 hypothetical protein E4L95_17250 [Paracoccus liaowanqingii]
MIGVVVWSNASREKAIIWCEDQSTLAYLQGRANFIDAQKWPDGLKWPQAGDLVELETRTAGNLRHAFNVSMLSEQMAPHLPQILSQYHPEPRGPQLRVVSQQEWPQGPASSPHRGDDGYAPTRSNAAG